MGYAERKTIAESLNITSDGASFAFNDFSWMRQIDFLINISAASGTLTIDLETALTKDAAEENWHLVQTIGVFNATGAQPVVPVTDGIGSWIRLKYNLSTGGDFTIDIYAIGREF